MGRRGCGSRELVLAAYGALTGLEVCVVVHSDPGLRGLRGRVVGDFQRCLLVATGDGGRRCVLKHSGLFAFKLGPRCWLLLRGEEITGSPSERVRALGKGKGVRWLVRAGEKRRYSGCEAAGEDL
jgi:ribonuclease P protein subunit POP4